MSVQWKTGGGGLIPRGTRHTYVQSHEALAGVVSTHVGAEGIQLVHYGCIVPTPLSSVPPVLHGGTMYYDDGTNTDNGAAAWRVYSTSDGEWTTLGMADRTATVDLAGTAWASVPVPLTGHTGVFDLHVTPVVTGGPVSKFSVARATPTAAGNTQEMMYAPAADGTRIRIRWNAASAIEISKDSAAFDGGYVVRIS